jgi:hypothetical protein
MDYKVKPIKVTVMQEVKVGQIWNWAFGTESMKIKIENAGHVGAGSFWISGRILESTAANYKVGNLWEIGLDQHELARYQGPTGFMAKYHWTLEQDSDPSPSDNPGLNCQNCHLFYSYVMPNRNNNTYICYNCRM